MSHWGLDKVNIGSHFSMGISCSIHSLHSDRTPRLLSRKSANFEKYLELYMSPYILRKVRWVLCAKKIIIWTENLNFSSVIISVSCFNIIEQQYVCSVVKQKAIFYENYWWLSINLLNCYNFIGHSNKRVYLNFDFNQ